MNLTAIAMVALLVILFSGLVSAAYAAKRWGFPVAQAALEGWWSDRWNEVEERLLNVEKAVHELPATWEEFYVDARKQRERARWHVRRVQKELEKRGLADDEIDSLSDALRPAHGEGGDGSGLQPLSDAMAEDATPAAPPDPLTAALIHKWRLYG